MMSNENQGREENSRIQENQTKKERIPDKGEKVDSGG